MNNMEKAIVAVVVAAIGAVVTALGPGNNDFGDITTQTWLVAIGAVLGSGALVYIVDNIPGVFGGVAKAALAFGSAGVTSLIAAFNDGVITQGEWLTALSTAIVATGLVYQTPAITAKFRPARGTTVTPR